jgi:hypothetical protein
MTGYEAIPKLTALISTLIERVKDRQTAALVQQVQEFHQQIITEYQKIQAENLELKAHQSHLTVEWQKLQADNFELKAQLSQAHKKTLFSKFGILWDHAGTPYCPRCEKSGMQIVWQTHLQRQVKAFRCSCAQFPIVLLDAGKYVNADVAMKLMGKGKAGEPAAVEGGENTVSPAGPPRG